MPHYLFNAEKMSIAVVDKLTVITSAVSMLTEKSQKRLRQACAAVVEAIDLLQEYDVESTETAAADEPDPQPVGEILETVLMDLKKLHKEIG